MGSLAEVNMGGGRDSPENTMDSQQAAMNYKFTADELRALKECNRESFYYRCLPFGAFMGTGTYFAVKAGYLSPSTRYGALPKVFAAVTVGYFLGKFSYQQRCVEKLMALPNSQLAEQLRRQRGRGGGGVFQESLTMQDPSLVMSGSSSFRSQTPNDDAAETSAQFTDVGDTRPMNAFDSDTSVFGAMDYHENETQMTEDTLPPKPPQFFTSYDNLRKQNREGYEQARALHIQNTLEAQAAAQRRAGQQPSSGPSSTSQPGKRKNAYGDDWDEKVE